jgi:RNA polymerase sigma factor (sigma-70 family)
MQATDPQSAGNPLLGVGSQRLRERLLELQGDMSAEGLADLLRLTEDRTLAPEALRDAASTRLMESFKASRNRACFGLLYELNATHLLLQVASRLRRYASKADPNDVLQEVFFNVYRYPHRFNSERDDAFRVWSAMIVRNTVLKHLRAHGRGGRQEVAFEDLSDQPLSRAESPLSGVIEDESTQECSRVYLTYLQLYLRFYVMLSDRERRALHLVEVEGVSYRVAAEDLMIKLENLKMVIFRARRKIHRAMRRVFDGLPHDCRPAREPRSAHELLMEDEQGVDARSTPTERADAGAPSDPRSATGRPIEYEADE